jgi:AcrR family transcriptional regulator
VTVTTDEVRQELRVRMLESAARLLAEQGPNAVSTRRVAAESGVSTMGVYTQFGSMEALVRAVVDEGFTRLAERFASVPTTGDAVADIARYTLAYVEHGRANPALYTVMFGAASMGPFRASTPEDLQAGRRDTFDKVVDGCGRAIAAKRFDAAEPFLIANQWWSATHGYTMLQLAGYIRAPAGDRKVLAPMLANLFVGFGDTRKRATASVSKAFAGLLPA